MSKDWASVAAEVADAIREVGLGEIVIVRALPAIIDEDHPEVPADASMELLATVSKIGNPKAEYRSGETVVKTDLAYMIEPVTEFTVAAGDVIRSMDGIDLGVIVHVERFGSDDVTIYEEIWANR